MPITCSNHLPRNGQQCLAARAGYPLQVLAPARMPPAAVGFSLLSLAVAAMHATYMHHIFESFTYFASHTILCTMQNDPTLNGKYLGTISQDFVKVADILKESSYQIRIRKFSDFPIFPVCKEEQPIGQLLLGKARMQTEWHYYASFLDEFSQRGLIENAADFKAAYKDPDEFCCLFVVDKEFTNFVFIPYPED